MSANDKVAATFHGDAEAGARRKTWAESPHPDDPRCELGNDGLTDEERDAGVAPMFEPPIVIDTSEPTPENELRVHVADLLADVDHFDGCHRMVEGDGTCTCLLGRLDAAIEVSSDPTTAAVDVIAREVTEQMLDPMDLGDLWSDYPDIGEDDWRDIVSRILDRAQAAKPDAETYKTAYAHLQGRAEAWAAENDPA